MYACTFHFWCLCQKANWHNLRLHHRALLAARPPQPPPHAEPKNSRACSDFVAHSPRAQRFTPNSVNHALTYPNVAPRMRNFDLADKRATGYYIQRALLLL
jgi:hypothetical protein